MTEISPPRAQNHLQLDPSTTLPPGAQFANGLSPTADVGDEEEYSTIKCICGFDEDDGNTVFCEECKTWQHIECYYPGTVVGDQFVHFCVDCKFRPVDKTGATQRQQARLGLVPLGERKAKRAPKTTQKKRAKDVPTSNGVRAPTAAFAQERGSGSPRDQPPPAKRPKTSHKSSSSTSVPHNVLEKRKRTGSTVTGRSPIKRQQSPPLYRGDYFTPSFMQLNRNNNFTEVRNNSYASISLHNELTRWLSDPDTLSRHTNRPPAEIFQRWVKPMEELEQMSPGVSKRMEEDVSLTVHGLHPIHTRLTVDTAAAPNTYIGELKGEIVRKDDYSNEDRWAELDHPEPFVFFHDSLPILIDSRREGTNFRYIRRSCDPNVKMQIIVLGAEYHFCLVSSRAILEDEEITLGWTLPEKAHHILANWIKHGLDFADEEYMVNWAGGVLSNFGGCACGRPQGSCPLDRFDRRIHPNTPPSAEKSFKVKKTKKNGLHISPSSTGRAVNSRAASEAVNGDVDDDNADTRSLSTSSRSKPTSRDVTPTVGVGLGVELSDREKRKLRQEEKLFEQLEFQELQGAKKKKRNSAGSALNTPALNSSKQLGFPDSANPSPTNAYTISRQRINGVMPTIRSGKSTNGTSTPALRQKPIYADASTQVREEELEPTSQPPNIALLRNCRGSHIQRLLGASRAERERRNRLTAERKASYQACPVSQPSSPMDKTAPSKYTSTATSMPPPPIPAPATARRSASPSRSNPSATADGVDVEMEDVDASVTKQESPTPAEQLEQTEQLILLQAEESAPLQRSPSPLPPQPKPAPPPLEEDRNASLHASSDDANAETLPPTTSRAPSLHVKLPPTPSFPSHLSHTPTTPSITGTPTPGSASLQSPLALQTPSPSMLTHPPLFSPGLTGSAVAPSPQKKKISLSDYTRMKREMRLARSQVDTVTNGKPAAAAATKHASEITGSDVVSSPVATDEASKVASAENEVEAERKNSDAASEDGMSAAITMKSESDEAVIDADAPTAAEPVGPLFPTTADEAATTLTAVAPTAPMTFGAPVEPVPTTMAS